MAVDRDAMRDIFVNSADQYISILGKRGQGFIRQYVTKKMKTPSLEEMRSLSTINHLWKVGDKYWKLAQTHYGDSELWWVIAWFNEKPTEAHCKNGDIIYVPFPLERLYVYFGL